MRLSELIEQAKAILESTGDLRVCSGLARSGYGEPVLYLDLASAKLCLTDEPEIVVDMVLDDDSLFEN